MIPQPSEANYDEGAGCCEKRLVPFPSGRWWIHSRKCILAPNEKFRAYGDKPKEPQPTLEDSLKPPVPCTCVEGSPWQTCVCKTCPWCVGYVEAHLDDDD